ncbi:MAG: acyl-CoA dehydrogenase family protein [Deltaproteobacteria bacterium]
MTLLVTASRLWISFLLIVLLNESHSFAIIVPGELECKALLAKFSDHPLRPVGTIEQETIFKLIDQVAQEFMGNDKFHSPTAWRQRTASSGLPGLDLPEDVGGKGYSARKMVNIFEFAGRHSLDLRDVSGGGHSRTLLDSTKPEQREVMKGVAEGKNYVAIAITEPTHGSDIAGMKSVSKKADGGYLITGKKKYNARLENGTHVVIFTQAPSSSADHPKLNAFLLPLNYPGLKIESLEASGLKGNSFGGVSFDNLFVPEKYLIGEDGQGREILGKHFTYWRIMQTAAAIGTANRALEMTSQRLLEREVYDKPLASMTHLTQPLGKWTYRLHLVMRDLERAAQLYDEGKWEEADELATAAKSEGVEFAHQAAEYALKTHGAQGYSDELDLEKRVRDLLGLTIADGASDVLMSSYVRKKFGKPFWDIPFGRPKEKGQP